MAGAVSAILSALATRIAILNASFSPARRGEGELFCGTFTRGCVRFRLHQIPARQVCVLTPGSYLSPPTGLSVWLRRNFVNSVNPV